MVARTRSIADLRSSGSSAKYVSTVRASDLICIPPAADSTRCVWNLRRGFEHTGRFEPMRRPVSRRFIPRRSTPASALAPGHTGGPCPMEHLAQRRREAPRRGSARERGGDQTQDPPLTDGGRPVTARRIDLVSVEDFARVRQPPEHPLGERQDVRRYQEAVCRRGRSPRSPSGRRSLRIRPRRAHRNDDRFLGVVGGLFDADSRVDAAVAAEGHKRASIHSGGFPNQDVCSGQRRRDRAQQASANVKAR